MLTLSAKLQEEMITHCRSRYPKEACGLLAGKDGTVVQVYRMTNVEDSPIGYSMDPKEQLTIEKQMRLHGQRMIGIYHSHTSTEAFPSPVDVRLSISPEVSYVLVSLKDQAHPDVKSYRIEGTTIISEEVVTDADRL